MIDGVAARLLATSILGKPLGRTCKLITVEQPDKQPIKGIKMGDILTFYLSGPNGKTYAATRVFSVEADAEAVQ